MVAYVHRRQCELVTLKPVLYYCIFDRMVLKTATGTDVANISFMQKEVFFFFSRSMAYYAFFIEGIEVAWTEKVDAKRERNKQNKTKKKNQQNVYQKLKQMSSACSISQSLLSSVVNMFQMTFSWKKKKYLYNIVECEGNSIPGIGFSKLQ